VALVRSGTPLKQVAAELGVSEQTLRNWRRQGDVDAGRAEGLTTVEVLERLQVGVAERLAPHRRERSEQAGVDDPVVRARLQVDARASGHVARQRPPGEARLGELFGEARQHHVDDGGFERAAHEASAHALGGEFARAVGLHARLFEEPPVDGELPLLRVA
jgi:transposase-like protein